MSASLKPDPGLVGEILENIGQKTHLTADLVQNAFFFELAERPIHRATTEPFSTLSPPKPVVGTTSGRHNAIHEFGDGRTKRLGSISRQRHILLWLNFSVEC